MVSFRLMLHDPTAVNESWANGVPHELQDRA